MYYAPNLASPEVRLALASRAGFFESVLNRKRYTAKTGSHFAKQSALGDAPREKQSALTPSASKRWRVVGTIRFHNSTNFD